MTVLAVTGTNGKTTVTRWLAQAMNHLGQKAAVIGTLGYGDPDGLKPHSGLTTPDVVGMHHLLHDLHRQGFDAVCLEASSIGLDQRRLARVRIDAALFTNLSQDHLDYHGSMEAYGQAKLMLAAWPTLRFAVVNRDDPFGALFQAEVEGHSVECISVGKGDEMRCRILAAKPQEHGQLIELKQDGQLFEINASVLGDFNADNMALVFATLGKLSFPLADVVQALAQVTPAPGRMQKIPGQPSVIVDYAHTPDALEKTLLALRPFAEKRSGRLWLVFGCGGDRDRSKRPLMGAVASAHADEVVITSDNPRSENPETIVQEILAGIDPGKAGHVHRYVNRSEAIEYAIAQANAQDVILLAGKGHESTQTIGTQVIPHSDERCALAMLAQRSAHA